MPAIKRGAAPLPDFIKVMVFKNDAPGMGYKE